MPVDGSKLVFTPTWINVWNIKSEARPHNELLINLSSWLMQFLIILKEIYKKTRMIMTEIIEPYSSEIIAII